MKILFLSDNFYPETSAAASRVFERALYWAQMGHQVTVITGCPNFPEGRPYKGYKNQWRKVENIKGLRVVRVKTFMSANEGFGLRILDFLSFMVSGFFFSLFEQKPDVVIASSPQFFTAVSGYLTSVFKHVSFGLEIADLWPQSIRAVGAMRNSFFLRALESIELFLYRKSSFIITLSPSIAKNITKRGINPKKVSTVINAVDLDFFKPSTHKDSQLMDDLSLSGKFVVGYIGTLGMAHNLMNLLKTAHLFMDEGNQSIHFLLVGSGAEREKLSDYIQREALKNVTMVPRQAKKDIPKYWSLVDLSLVHLINRESFKTVIPSKIFESMALGKPILYCGPESDGSQIILGAGAGEHIASGNPKDLKASIEKLWCNPDLLASYQRKSQGAAQNHSREQQARQFLSKVEFHMARLGKPIKVEDETMAAK